MKVNIAISSIVTAFNNKAIGTKVKRNYIDAFIRLTEKACKKTNFDECRVPGQAVIELPPSACKMVSGGIGKRIERESCYVVRKYRDKIGLYLHRRYALAPDSVSIVVYTKEAKPQHFFDGYTCVLVAVLASCGPKSPLGAGRFVANLAGGNNEALLWSGNEIREKAKEINNYFNTYCVVAD
jgi:hypothetical protein